jgi:hypothetical protein
MRWTGGLGGGGSTGWIGMSVIGPSRKRAGRSIFALITTATSATWAAMIASIALGLEERSAVRGAVAA